MKFIDTFTDADAEDVSRQLRAAREAELQLQAQQLEEWGLKFSKARRVNTAKGCKLVRSAVPNEIFWAAWRADKTGIKARGYSLSQWEGSWQVSHWADPKDVINTLDLLPKWELRPLAHPEGLLPYQPVAVQHACASLRHLGTYLDASDTGTGKTYIALAACRELGLRPMVLCPRIVKPSWKRAAAHLGVELITVESWEKVRTGNTPYGSWNKDEAKLTFSWTLPKDGVVIFDEAHRAKNPGTKNSKLVTAAKRQGLRVIVLSATICENPLDLRAVGYTLGLHDDRSFYSWVRRYGCSEGFWGGWEFNGDKRQLAKLHEEIFPTRGHRTRTSDLGDLFPDNDVRTELIELDAKTTAEIQEAYQELNGALDLLESRTLQDGDKPLAITRRLRAAQRIELLIAPGLAEQAADDVEAGRSVVLFFSFNESVRLAAEILGDYSPAVVWGSDPTTGKQQTEEETEEQVQRFQTNATRVFICNTAKAREGIGLQDLDGNHPRVSRLTPNDNARTIRQALGRIPRAGTKSKCVQRIVGVAGTVQEKILANFEAKINCLDALNDGDLRG